MESDSRITGRGMGIGLEGRCNPLILVDGLVARDEGGELGRVVLELSSDSLGMESTMVWALLMNQISSLGHFNWLNLTWTRPLLCTS